ncbi:MAG TPA: 1-deoxy-D-xylulose-5-phosphate reductoisomerase [Bacteroidota bacterium]
MINIAVLGSTGSIGRSTLEVIAAFPDRFRACVLTAHSNVDLLQEQIRRFRPATVVVSARGAAEGLRGRLNGSTRVLSGEAGLVEAVTGPAVDVVVSALVGFAGLMPTLRAIEAGKQIALANKETLVVGGELIMEAVRKHGVRLLPVDSEHSAILQCLQGEDPASVARLILTASGGPFRDVPCELLAGVTPEQALAHPTWRMGNKVTIDSATMMNKGLEVIEAYWLFGLPRERIQVLVHPQSIIHSLVEFVDGSVKAQLGVPDMKIPIQYALTFPERGLSMSKRLDLAAVGSMTFFPPDLGRFRCLGLAFEALREGGTAPAVMNAANEVAVQLFLEGKIGFQGIPAMIEEALAGHAIRRGAGLEELIEVDRETRSVVHQRAIAAE